METSTKKTHTPGPWEVGDDGISTPFVGDRIIVNTGEECAEADARLIAAAPDLLAACEDGLRRFDENDATDALEWVNTELRAAIAKARGR